VLDGELR